MFLNSMYFYPKRKARNNVTYMAIIIDADDLVTQGAKVSTAMIITKLT